MDAQTYELKTILTLERRFVIPTFQRDYEWTEDGQWRLLFDDLEVVIDRLEQERNIAAIVGDAVTKADKKVAPHFLGAIVLDRVPTAAGSIDMRSVIDGQQRLTTLQLLVRGILDVLIASGSPREKQVRRLIQNPADVVHDDDERHKVWPRRRDRSIWRLAMADDFPADSDHLYFKARAYFRKRARVATEGNDGSDRTDVVVDALLDLFKLVVIDLEDNDDAQVIFEVLNGRQTPLSATDLVKNLLFLRAELSDEAALESLYDEHWAHFDDEWWKEEIGRGHAARGRRDVLLSSWLTVTTGSEVNIGHLYREARMYLDDERPKIEFVLQDLTASATAFRAIFQPPPTLPERMLDAYRRVVQQSVTTALPLLVWLRTLPEDEFALDDHVRAVVAVDSWLTRRVIVGSNTRGYGKRFVDVLKAAQTAREKGDSIIDAIEANLLTAGSDNLTWPSDGEVEHAFLTRPFYNNLTQERIRMLLGAIDRQLHLEHPKGEHPQFDYDKLQIEHILPQAWQTYWPVTAEDEAAKLLAEQERERVVNRLGNLTLVTGPLNIPMSNGPWTDKRAALEEHSNLRLNAGLKAIQLWDEAGIEQRAKTLAAVACRVWPRPGSIGG